jgi:hypothetical protein
VIIEVNILLIGYEAENVFFSANVLPKLFSKAV